MARTNLSTCSKVREKHILNVKKTINKAVKKAKQFAVRKLCRRLVTARGNQKEEGGETGSGAAETRGNPAGVAKIELQLAEIRRADVAALSQQIVDSQLAAAIPGKGELGEAEKETEGSDSDGDSGGDGGVGDEFLQRQLCQATCVKAAVTKAKEQLDALRAQIEMAEEKEKKYKHFKRKSSAPTSQTDEDGGVEKLASKSKQNLPREGGHGPDNPQSSGKKTQPPKKRMGQRARQQQAEAKYGSEAKHLAKLKSTRMEQPSAASPGFSKANKGHFPKKDEHGTEDDANLHPSWLAKKKQKLMIPLTSDSKPHKVVFGEHGVATDSPANVAVREEYGSKHVNRKVPSQQLSAKVDDPKTGHPSWDAKQREKQRLAMLSQVKGKKVLFSDE